MLCVSQMLTGLNCVGTGKGVTVEFSMNGRNMTKGIKENQKLLKIIKNCLRSTDRLKSAVFFVCF